MSRPFVLALLLVLGAACKSDGLPSGTIGEQPPPKERPTLNPTYRPTGHAAAGDVVVHLFDWRWADIANECEAVLGPAGVHAVQVSPPQEHSITPSHGTGSNGTAYTKYSYPGLYAQSDFHTPCGINSYQDAAQVQDCELLSLPDLNTGSASVREKIAGYLLMLARLGVAGFRVDAAKHIQQVELDSIIALVNRPLAAEGKPLPYFFLEVVAGGGEALSEQDYFGEGYDTGGGADITEFTFVGVGDKFRQVGGQRISDLNPNGPPGRQFSAAAWGMIPSDKAVVFLQNHDTQHDCGLGYRQGDVFRLANVWMLAQPYGYPSVLSSFAFNCPSGNSMGPPSDAQGWTLPVSCASSLETATIGQWVCEHRDPSIRNMVRFRKVVAGTEVANWWDNGANAIAFSRGDKGFVAINNESTTVTATVATGLAAGSYCDVITGGRIGAACAGTSITVDAAGNVQLNLGSKSAIAIDTATRL